MNPLKLRSIALRCMACTWLATVSFGASAQAAQPDPGTLRLVSRLVQLDVTVLDKAGHPVTDLRRDEFSVYENGTQQPIRNFEAFDTHPLRGGLTAASIQNTRDLQALAPDAPVTVLVLDEFNTDFFDTAFARDCIRKYLLAQPSVLRQPTTFLAATDAGFQQVVDYTLDRQKLLTALAHLPGVLPGSLLRTAGTREGRALRFMETLASLEQVASASQGHKGRKNILWIGRGFESIDLRDEPDGQVKLVKDAAERAVNLLRLAHATVYTIDPTLSTKFTAGLDTESTRVDADAFTAESHSPRDPFDGTVSFNTFAPETGGRAFAVFNDLDAEISTSVQQGSAFYTLAYVPVGAIDPEQPYRQIRVKVSRPGLRVVTRRGYYTATPSLPVRTSGQELKAQGFDLGNAISSGITYTGLGISASLSRKDATVCVVQVATRDIAWQDDAEGNHTAHLTLVAVGVDGKGKPVGKGAKEIVARLGPDKQLAQIPFVTLQIPLPIQGKAVKYRVAVRDLASGNIGTAELGASE